MARNEIAKKIVREDATGVDFNFIDGTILAFDVATLPESIAYKGGSVNARDLLACHGLSQKIGDSYAGAAGNVADAIEWAQTTIELLTMGEWSERKEGVGPRPSRVANAVMRVLTATGKTFDEAHILAKYSGKDGKAARDSAMARADVKAAYDAIAAEEAAERAEASKAAAATATAASVDELAA